jgi:hypothetical protein
VLGVGGAAVGGIADAGTHASAAAARPIVYVNSHAVYSVQPDGSGWRRLNECFLNPVAGNGRRLIGGFSHVPDRSAPLLVVPASKEVINDCDNGPREPSVRRYRLQVRGSRVTSWITLAWSADGRRVVGVGKVGSGELAPQRVVVFNANGSGYRVVTPQALDGVSSEATDAVWSPRGDRIAFGRGFESSDCPEFVETRTVGLCNRRELAVMNVDGSNARSLHRPAQIDEHAADDLPEGSTLRNLPSVVFRPFAWHGNRIFMTTFDALATDRPARIAVINDDGTGFRYVTPRGADLRRPALSPDGKQIALVWQPARGKEMALYVMSSSGGPLRQVRVRQPLMSATCSRGSVPGRKTCTTYNLGFDQVAW